MDGICTQHSEPSPEREFVFTEADFKKISRMIYVRAGIFLSPAKREMVYSRLSRRLRVLGIACFAEYLDVLDQGNEAEWNFFVGALTTHLTAFFREPHHFPIMVDHVAERARSGKVLLWSCAASTGEEPYSMAMAVAEYFDSMTPPVTILATDVDVGVLDMAREGVYPLERVHNLPEKMLKKFFLKGGGDHRGFVRVKPELREWIRFQQLNLLNPVWPMRECRYDAIFCRNVIIYFDRTNQQRVLERCRRHLKADGLFFAGHSENLHYASEVFQACGRTVYRPRVAASPFAVSSRPTALAGECAS